MARTVFGNLVRGMVLGGLLLVSSLPGRLDPVSAGPEPKALDWNREILYFILIDRFHDGDKTNNFRVNPQDPYAYHGGDLQGIIDKLDDLQDLGVTTLWLSPVFDNRDTNFFKDSAYHGYWVKDFFRVDEHFGTMATLQELSTKLHQRGMRLILDMVVNHTDYDSSLVETHPDWFHPDGSITDWNDQHQVENYRVTGLPDFAQENPAAKEYLFRMSRWWIDQVRPDGFRLDAVKHVPLGFWREYNDMLRQYAGPSFLLLGEVLHGDPNYTREFFDGGKFSSLFDFPLYYTMLEVFGQDKSARQLGLRLYDDRKYQQPQMLATILDNHDLERFITSCKGDERRLRMALTFMLTARGIPTIYYGTEVALSGGQDPDNRRDMRFGSNPDLRAYLRQLTHLRRSSTALTSGLQVPLYQDDRVYAFARVAPSEQAIVAFNNSDQAQTVTIPLGIRPTLPTGERLTDLLGGQTSTVRPEGLPVTLGPRSFAIFNRKSAANAYAPYLSVQLRRLRDPASAGLVEVDFRISGITLQPGERLYVIGGLPEIGQWNPEQALGPMQEVTAGSYSKRVRLPAGALFEYKYVIRGAGAPRWQDAGNACQQVPERGAVQTDDRW